MTRSPTRRTSARALARATTCIAGGLVLAYMLLGGAPGVVDTPRNATAAELRVPARTFYQRYRVRLAEFLDKADDIRFEAMGFDLPAFYCQGSRDRINDRLKLLALDRRLNEARAEYNKFKNAVNAAAANPAYLQSFVEAGVSPGDPNFWAKSDGEFALADAAIRNKLLALDKVPVRDCTERPPAPRSFPLPPGPSNVMAGLKRPDPYNPQIPPAPLTFCSEAERYKFLIEVWGPLITEAGRALRAATAYARVVQESIVALNRQNRDAEADPLRRESVWADQEVRRRQDIFDAVNKLRAAAYSAKIIDCGPRTTVPPPGSASPGQPPAPAPADKRVGFKIPDTDSPRPQDRVYLGYNYYVEGGAGAQFDSFKQTTLGTLFVPGNDRPFLFSRGAATGFDVGTALELRQAYAEAGRIFERDTSPTFWAGQRFYRRKDPQIAEFFFNFSRSSATASGSTGPGDVAVLTLIQPFNGATVVGFGQADASIRSSQQSFNFGATMPVFSAPLINTPQNVFQYVDVMANLGFRFQRTETEHDGRITSPLFPGFFAEQRLNTNDNYVGPVLKLNFNTAIGTNGSFPPIFVDVGAWLAPSLRISDGSAKQHVVIPGAAPPFNDFTVSMDKNRIGFALLGGVNTSLSVPVLPNLVVGVGGGFTFNTAQSHWEIPISPGGSASLRTDTRVSGRVGAFARFRFLVQHPDSRYRQVPE